MATVGITVDLGRYEGTVHYVSCGLYTGYHAHTNRLIPASLKMKMCKVCKPSAEDVLEIAGVIAWVPKRKKEPKGGDAMSKLAKRRFDDGIENVCAQRELTGGRTLRPPGSDSEGERFNVC
jgi:hypothetical protein